MLGFVIGFLIGGSFGMFLTAAITVASNDDDKEDAYFERREQ